MKKLVLLITSLMFMFGAVGMVLADKGTLGLSQAKAGDEIFVCGCGEKCDCGTMANKQGKCSCKKDLVKATVTKVEDGKVFYMVKGQELSAPQQGKFACGCGEACKCGTISQKAGKCACNKDLIKVE